MIKVKRRYKFESATGGSMTYTLTPDTECVAITPSSGTVTSGQEIDFEFDFATIDCFNTEFTLQVVDPNCSTPKEINFVLTSPCSTLNTSISNTPGRANPYVFASTTTGGTADYSYSWSYDTSLFSATSSTGPSIELNFIDKDLPSFTTVTLTVTDANGCVATDNYVYTTCRPVIQSQVVELECGPTTGVYNAFGTLNLADMSSCTLRADFNTLSLDYNTNALNVTTNNNQLTIQARSTTIPTTYDIIGSVANTSGARGEFTITVVVPGPCAQIGQPVYSNTQVVLDSGYSNGDIVEIPLVLNTPQGTDINYDSFTFVPTKGQTLNSATNLSSTNGTAVYKCGERYIEYTIDTKNEEVDLIQFQIETEDGKVSNIAKAYIDYENYSAPTATDDTLTMNANSSQSLDLSANDSGDIDFTTYEILSVESGLTVRNNNDGTINISAGDITGDKDITYRFRSTNGVYSNTGTAVITVNNTGTGARSVICPTTLNLNDFLTGTVTSGGTWTAGNNPSSPSLTNPSAVDFSSANPGTYTFTYTVGTASTNIILVIPDYSVVIDSVSAVTKNPIAGTVGSTVSFTTTGVDSAANISIEVDFGSGTNIDVYPPDSWDATSGIGVVFVQFAEGSGTYDISVKAVDRCANAQSDTWSTITI